jgi:F-type H+-transporting ATPase subunit gamma
VTELARSLGREVEHPLLRRPTDLDRKNRIALVVISSNRGLAGAYNGSVLRGATAFLREQTAAGQTVDLYVAGKKGASYFNFQKRPITLRVEVSDPPKFSEVNGLADRFIDLFTRGEIDGVYVAYMNFISTGTQRAEVLGLLPLGELKKSIEHLAHQVAEKEAQLKAGALDARRSGADVAAEAHGPVGQTQYDFSPDPKSLLDEILPLTVKAALFQAFMDAATSEHVARMVAMKSATDNADKMVKSLTMQYNRARQSQITTELAEIMGGVESMKK